METSKKVRTMTCFGSFLIALLFAPFTLVHSFFSLSNGHIVSSRGKNRLIQPQLCLSKSSNEVVPSCEAARRLFIQSLLSSPAILAALAPGEEASSAELQDLPVTHTVFFDVRISRQDGSFYVRDDLPDTPENQVFAGRILIELFGTLAPNHVQEFLKYVNVSYDPVSENPLPSYGRSVFTRLDQASGLLEGGSIPGLEVTEIGGGAALRYGGRVLPASLWIEKGKVAAKISHGTAKGLVTHRLLDLSPSFGITTRKAPELDATHFVFGRVKPDETMIDFLTICEDLPTYSVDRPRQGLETTAADDVTAKLYSTQKEFFRRAAKTFGDTRLDKVYEGKLLRRVDVTQVGLL